MIEMTELNNNGWQPMETAPRDRNILLYCHSTGEQKVGIHMTCLEDGDEMWVIARGRDEEGTAITFGCSPDMWQELPEPPEL